SIHSMMRPTCCTSSTPGASRAAPCCCRPAPLALLEPPPARRSPPDRKGAHMATSSVAVQQRAAAESKYGPTDWWGGWRVCILACLGFSVLFIALGIYIHAFAWSAGIYAASPEFALYWRSLLVLELLGVGI